MSNMIDMILLIYILVKLENDSNFSIDSLMLKASLSSLFQKRVYIDK